MRARGDGIVYQIRRNYGEGKHWAYLKKKKEQGQQQLLPIFQIYLEKHFQGLDVGGSVRIDKFSLELFQFFICEYFVIGCGPFFSLF